jgi:hypothetical protein
MTLKTKLNPEEKIQLVLSEIIEEMALTPDGQPLELHRSHESDVSIDERSYHKIIHNLEKERNLITVLPDNRKEGSFDPHWNYPSRFTRLQVKDKSGVIGLHAYQKKQTKLSDEDLAIKVQQVATWWGMPQSEREMRIKTGLAFLNTAPMPNLSTLPSMAAMPAPEPAQPKRNRRKETITQLIRDIQDFKFCSPSDDPEEHTAVTAGFHHLITMIKVQAAPILAEPYASQLADIDVEINNVYSAYEANAQISALIPEIEDALDNFDGTFPAAPLVAAQSEAKQPELRITFSDHTGELVLNDLFALAKPTINGQNYRIIRYLIANPNRFISAEDIEAKALDGKSLDKRLTDFAAQMNMNKDLGKLFFDTGKDGIRLNNPVTQERMAEKGITRIRIKPA